MFFDLYGSLNKVTNNLKVGNHINVQTGAWTATDAGIGAGVDSYYEYLVKGAFLFDKPEMMRQFKGKKNQKLKKKFLVFFYLS